MVSTSSVRPGGKVLVILAATIEPGWHLYSLTTPKGGPNATTVKFMDNPVVARIRVFQPVPIRTFDPAFKLDTETFTKQVRVLLEVTMESAATRGAVELEARVRYQACQDKLCLPPRTKSAKTTLQIDPSAKPLPFKVDPGYTEVAPL